MIPIRDDNPTRSLPFVTWSIVALNIIVFFNQAVTPGDLIQYALVPIEITTGRHLARYPIVEPAWITIFSSMFMHGGLLHIGSNMLYLIIFGNNIEDRLGHARFLFFYLACGILAAVAHIISGPMSVVPTLGASGAVAGVLGAYLVLYPHARITCLLILFVFITTIEVPAIIVLGFWIVGQLMSANIGGGMQPTAGGVAYWAHIGGFFAGIILIFLLGGYQRHNRRRYRWD